MVRRGGITGRNTLGAGFGADADVGESGSDELVADRVEACVGRRKFKDAAADADHEALEHEGDGFGVGGEGFRGAGQHIDDGAGAADAHLLADFRAVNVGADRVEGCGGFGVAHLGREECGDQSGDHISQRLALLLEADALDFAGDEFEMTAEGGLQQGALVGEVLVKGADGDSGARGDKGGGETLLAVAQQNLNGGLQHGVDRGDGTRL
jgi:hypothetical protein